MGTATIQNEQVDKNYEAFKEKLGDLLRTDRDRFALMHNGEVIACFDTVRDAFQAGRKMFNEEFSVQKVTDQIIDMGFLSHARVGR